MGKRSNFERNPKDFYQTPIKAVKPLLDFGFLYNDLYEPCYGEGALVKNINEYSDNKYNWIGVSDAENDARELKVQYGEDFMFVTNPPWSRNLLHPIIENLSSQAPTWLLIDAGWMHTKQARPYLEYCSHIISIGRVKWIEGSKYTSLDDCCWYLFDREAIQTIFINKDFMSQ